MNNDPVQMYLYVLNNVDYQPYFGSVKGSQGTYWERAGNDMDQASFLMALFRSAGYPARYICGSVLISISQAMNWTGAKTADAAVNIMQSNGIPLETVTAADGSIIGVWFAHTWVLLHVHDSLHGHKWVQLDPSFKQFQYVDGIDLKQAVGFDFNSFYNSAIAGATINEAQSYVTNLNSTNIQNNLQAYANNFQTWVNMNFPTATVGDVLGCRQIVPQQTDKQFHNAFPFQTFTPQAELSVLLDSHRYLANFQMQGFSYDISLPELYGKRLSLAYVPASDYDRQLIEAAGGIFNVFALMVNMKPQLKVEGQVVAEGQGVTLGSSQICRSSFLRPLETAWDSNDKYVTTGANYCISLDCQRISPDLIQQRANNFQILVNTPPTNDLIHEVGEEALNITGMVYFAEVEIFSNAAASSSKITWTREPAEAFLAIDLTVNSFFGIPLGVQPGGLGIDVKRYPVSPVSTVGNPADEISWMIASGTGGSACEHAVFEQLYQIEAVSTEKLLSLANNQGIPIYAINQENLNQILPYVNAPGSFKQSMSDSVNSGCIVVVPQTGLQVNHWYGYTWQVIDPNTGATGSYIGGSLTSGSMMPTSGGDTDKPLPSDMLDPHAQMPLMYPTFNGNLTDLIPSLPFELTHMIGTYFYWDIAGDLVAEGSLAGLGIVGTTTCGVILVGTGGLMLALVLSDFVQHLEWKPIDP